MTASSFAETALFTPASVFNVTNEATLKADKSALAASARKVTAASDIAASSVVASCFNSEIADAPVVPKSATVSSL